MLKIEISGPVSSGKTPMAQAIKRQAENMEKTVFISDQLLYEFERGFKNRMVSEYEYAKEKKYDVCVLVIGTVRDQPNPQNSGKVSEG